MNVGRLGTIFHSNDKYLESYLSAYESAVLNSKKVVRSRSRLCLYCRTTADIYSATADRSGSPANKSIITTISLAQFLCRLIQSSSIVSYLSIDFFISVKRIAKRINVFIAARGTPIVSSLTLFNTFIKFSFIIHQLKFWYANKFFHGVKSRFTE